MLFVTTTPDTERGEVAVGRAVALLEHRLPAQPAAVAARHEDHAQPAVDLVGDRHDSSVEEHRGRAARPGVRRAPARLRRAVVADDQAVQGLVGDDVRTTRVGRDATPDALAEVEHADRPGRGVDGADESGVRGPPDPPGPVGGEGHDAVAVRHPGLEVPAGVGVEVRLAVRRCPDGGHLTVPRGDDGAISLVEVERLVGARRAVGSLGQAVGRDRAEGLAVDDPEALPRPGRAERDDPVRRGELEPPAALEPEPRGLHVRLSAERSGALGRVAGAAVGVLGGLRGDGLGRGGTTDVRRRGPDAGRRRDRQPAVGHDHDHGGEGCDGARQPDDDAAVDVDPVLDPPAHARDGERGAGDDEHQRSPGDPEEHERADQPDHRATVGEPAAASREAHRGATDAWVTPSVGGRSRPRCGDRELREDAVARTVAQEDP